MPARPIQAVPARQEQTMKKFLVMSSLALALGACGQTEASDRALGGAAIGGATGAVVGGLATGRPGGALAGAAIGAAGGAVIGAATTPQRDCYYDGYGRRICNYY
jgi:osmotically inducible lipoprotein OsmB